MRILILTNLFPPHYVGGYELGCKEVADRLAARGHAVRVLTSTFGLNGAEVADGVHRRLPNEWQRTGGEYAWLLRRESASIRAFREVSRDFRPDVVYVWNMARISIATVSEAQRRGRPVCYYVSDNWLAASDTDPWLSLFGSPHGGRRRRAARSALRLLARARRLPTSIDGLDLRRAQFTSAYLRRHTAEAGKPVSGCPIIPWGVDSALFPFRSAVGPRPRILFAGQVVPHKGVETAIRALASLVADPAHSDVQLTIAGGSVIPDYVARMREQVVALGLDQNVRFTGMLSRDELRRVYQEHDILVFPSIWDEPFSITVLEAMSSGLAIVATPTGGTPEILEHEVNALLFPPEDSDTCAAHIRRLLDDRALLDDLRCAGNRIVRERYRMDGMVDRIESELQRACA